jgi:hypothetical protein
MWNILYYSTTFGNINKFVKSLNYTDMYCIR